MVATKFDENDGTSGADVKVTEPGGIYRMDGINLELVFGDKITDSLAGT